MKNLLIDTNIYTHALAGDFETIDVLRHAQKNRHLLHQHW